MLESHVNLYLGDARACGKITRRHSSCSCNLIPGHLICICLMLAPSSAFGPSSSTVDMMYFFFPAADARRKRSSARACKVGVGDDLGTEVALRPACRIRMHSPSNDER